MIRLNMNCRAMQMTNMMCPLGAPRGETARAYLQNELLNAVEESISNLNVMIDNWTPASKHIAVIANTGRDTDIEIDWGDAWFFRSFLKALKSLILIVTAYNLDVNLREIAALENLEALKFVKLLDRYEAFLKMLPQASNTTVNGGVLLNEAHSSLIEAIEDYIVASDAIRNDSDLTTGAEELVEIDECDYRVEEWMRNILTGIMDSLEDSASPDVLIVKEEEQWILTDDAPVSSFQIIIRDLESDSSKAKYLTFYGGEIVGSSGEIVCITIDGSNIYLKSESSSGYYAEIEFSGTLNAEGTQITGSYVGWNWEGALSGNFTADQIFFEEKTELINPNPVFGKGGGPFDLRAFLPAFNECDDPVVGTVGYGLGSDPTLGGILPDFTQDDWGLNPDPCILYDSSICGSLSVPGYSGSGSIYIQAFWYTGFYNLDPDYRQGIETIYADGFTEGMDYCIDYLYGDAAWPFFVSGWWDSEFKRHI